MKEWNKLDYSRTAREMMKSSNPFVVKLGEAIRVGNPLEKSQVSTRFARIFSEYYNKTLK